MPLRQRTLTMPCAATKRIQTCNSTAQMYRNMNRGSGTAVHLERTATMRNTKQKAPGTARPMRTRAVHACSFALLKSAENVPPGVNGSSSSICSFFKRPLLVCLDCGDRGITPVPRSPWVCKSVERRDDCTAARFPPAPFVTGANSARTRKCCTACLRMRPPKLLMSMDTITGVQPSLSTLSVCGLLNATLAEHGARRQKKMIADHCNHKQDSWVDQ
mmetsp:Transcript_37460/g.75586  ORF Transcript_37460/g.75586 Transcript_37460/m.75586 type:complete len:217 (+) Transcript_37460:314-964(+)